MFRTFCAALCASVIAMSAEAVPVRMDDPQSIPTQGQYSPPAGVFLDFDGDGTDDVRLYRVYWNESRSEGQRLITTGLFGAQIYTGGMLNAGDQVDDPLTFSTSSQSIASYGRSRGRFSPWHYSFGGTWRSNWTGLDNPPSTEASPHAIQNFNGFLGVVLSGGQFGWIQLDINAYGGGQVLAYGYETEIGVGIEAGAATVLPPVPLPSTGVTLLGALAGLHLLRRRRRG